MNTEKMTETDITKHGLCHKLRHDNHCYASGWPDFDTTTNCTCGLFDSLAKLRKFFVIRSRKGEGHRCPTPDFCAETNETFWEQLDREKNA